MREGRRTSITGELILVCLASLSIVPQLHHATSTEGSVNKLHTHGKTELGAEEQVKAHFNERYILLSCEPYI